VLQKILPKIPSDNGKMTKYCRPRGQFSGHPVYSFTASMN